MARSDQSVVLTIRGIWKKFGGVQALRDVDLTLKEGALHALIGPNGAGKTTLFNVLTGELQPSKGKVYLFGSELNDLPARKRVIKGISRTYQQTKLFYDLTVEENLFLAIKKGGISLKDLVRSWNSDENKRDKARKIAKLLELEQDLTNPVSEVSYGEQRQLQLGLAIASDPKLLLLDEPLAGLSAGERSQMANVIQQLALNHSVLLIEHNLDIALNIAERVTVLHKGEVIATGSPSEIRSNQEVQAIYIKEE